MEIQKSPLEILPDPAFSNLISFLTPQEICHLQECSSETKRKVEKCKMFISMDVHSCTKRQSCRNKILLPLSKPLWITVRLCFNAILNGISWTSRKIELLLKKIAYSSKIGKIVVYLSMFTLTIGVALIIIPVFLTISLLCGILFRCSRMKQKSEKLSKEYIKEILSYPSACGQLYDFFKEEKRFVDAQTECTSFFGGDVNHFSQSLIPCFTGKIKWLEKNSWSETTEIINLLPIYRIPTLLDECFEKLKQINHPINDAEEFKTYMERCL